MVDMEAITLIHFMVDIEVTEGITADLVIQTTDIIHTPYSFQVFTINLFLMTIFIITIFSL